MSDLNAASWSHWPSEVSDLLASDGNRWTMAYIHWSRDRWIGYVRGYHEAAELMLKQVEKYGRQANSLVYPFAMCWRHHIELQLKSTILLVQEYQREPMEFPRSHKLDVLWRRLHEPLLEISPDEDTLHIERLLLQLQEVDPTSEHFRYPVTASGGDTLASLRVLPMREFHHSMEGLANFFAGATEGLYEMTSARNEYEAEQYVQARHYEWDT
jgi:hypothetical protein